MPVDGLRDLGAAVTYEARDVLDRYPRVRHERHEAVAQFAWSPVLRIQASAPCRYTKGPGDVAGLQWCPKSGGEHEPVLLPLVSRLRTQLCLYGVVGEKSVDASSRQLDAATRFHRFGVAGSANGPSDPQVWWHRRHSLKFTFQFDRRPFQCSNLLGPYAAQQGHDEKSAEAKVGAGCPCAG